ADKRTLVLRRLVAKLLDWQISHHVAAVAHDETLRRRRFADHSKIEAPFAENGLGLFFLLWLENHEHALLALGQHHFVRTHALFAARHPVEIERDAEIALGTHFHRRACEPGGAHVLNGNDAPLLHDLETSLEQQLFRERIADLHGRALALRIFI